MKLLIGVTLAAAFAAAPSFAQDKPTVSGYLTQGYQVIQSEIGTLSPVHPEERQSTRLCSVERVAAKPRAAAPSSE
jgi:hypothetical protein